MDEVEELKRQIQKFASGEKVERKFDVDDLEKDEAVAKRCIKVVDAGVLTPLAFMARDEDEKNANVREVIAETLCNIAITVPTRGKIMQTGGLKVE